MISNLELMAVAPAILLVMVLPFAIYMGVQHSEMSAQTRGRSAAMVGMVLLAWFLIALFVSRTGFYSGQVFGYVPTISFGIFVPVGLGLWVLIYSRAMGELIDAIPQYVLVGVQAFRAFGFVFLILWLQGVIPGVFAVPAGFGDVLVGILAVILAMKLVAGTQKSNAIRLWNYLGLLDLAVAIILGTLTSPSPFQQLALDLPNVAIANFPLAMIPVFAVPVSILLHAASLIKLKRNS